MSVGKRLAAALVAGLLFGVGLGVSGMTNPTKVIGFLDVTGAWDPSLGLVMLGAVAVSFVAVRLARRRSAPPAGGSFAWPEKTAVDRGLVVGSAIFGVGWGLAGYCPGPGLVSAAAGSGTAIVFAAAMAAGMLARHASSRG